MCLIYQSCSNPSVPNLLDESVGSKQKKKYCTQNLLTPMFINPNLPTPFRGFFSVKSINLESITSVKVKIIANQDKTYMIAKRNV